MDQFQAALLGALQGLTEVLPISSSGHLIMVPRLLGWQESGLTFDVALHLGTMLALCAYFWRDIIELTLNFFTGLAAKRALSPQQRLPFYIIAGTIPAAIIGKMFEQTIEDIFRSSSLLIASFLIGFGLILAFADTMGAKRWKMERLTLGSALMVGMAQCLALIPGVSRSGITITAALLLGYNRETSARFSFLLSLPIVAGAGILKLGHLLKHGIPAGETQLLLIGIVTSALFGYASVAFLLKYVQRNSLYLFVWYRLLAGAAVLIWLFVAR
ncbi:undecaprenyl-diphosphatase UppP [Geobacter pelophilus]|uniref:Undecaprenyl-diphosphatase n=1 Tax=Geoanaerobacter pelophilus TaxID=60036 RepID=A0AAW4KZB8_9BACT|nr:undecaprenyl-diphosphatase UppP [Geoanaerobacter pelophilus]MBT0663993.1 undecaprenyl-diphosphatase UppP [Geoanaerobacter pelophilus]